MSYAQVAANNAPPISEQPHPDPALFQTAADREPTELPSVDTKVTVAPADYKEHPKAAATRIADELRAATDEVEEEVTKNHTGSSKRKAQKEKAQDAVHKAEAEGLQLWEVAKDTLLRPGVAGGLVGIVNVGLLSTIGYQLYSKPNLRSDTRFIGTSATSLLALFGAEGVLVERYRNTDAGRAEEKKAREEGATIYKHTKEVVLRPGVLGGLVGALNVGILGGVGYWSYANWDRPTAWDRKTVSAATVGLLTLFAGEGYLGEQYKEKEYPKRK